MEFFGMIAMIEEAVKAQIARAKLPYLRTLATYSGEFDTQLATLVRAFPAIWVAYKGESEPRAVSTAKEVWKCPATFLVMVGTYSLQNEQARHGGVTIGAYQMIADVRALLLRQKLGLAIDKLTPGRTAPLINAKLNGQGIAAYVMEWKTSYPMEVRREGREYVYEDLRPEGERPPQEGKPPYAPGKDGTTLPPLPELPPLLRVGMNYYADPPPDNNGGEPSFTDLMSFSTNRGGRQSPPCSASRAATAARGENPHENP